MSKFGTKEEDSILINNYHLIGTAVVSKLPGRTINAVKNRAQSLGLIYRQPMEAGTEAEVDILQEYYPIEGKKVLNRLPGRSLKTIQVMAHRLNIHRIYASRNK